MLPSSKRPDGPSSIQVDELNSDIASDPFSSYFNFEDDPAIPPKVLVTTSPKASKPTYEFCDELVGIFPGAEFIRRKKGKGFEMGRIAGWAVGRGYKHLLVVNEDMKKPSLCSLQPASNISDMQKFRCDHPCLSSEWTYGAFQAHFDRTYEADICRSCLVSFCDALTFCQGHARATPHNPELVLNNFSTSLGHGMGRMFQTLFPPLPEFQGRQVVTLHNQRDFLFFRRHR
jgi:ribosome production factor 1